MVCVACKKPRLFLNNRPLCIHFDMNGATSSSVKRCGCAYQILSIRVLMVEDILEESKCSDKRDIKTYLVILDKVMLPFEQNHIGRSEEDDLIVWR